MSAYHVPRNMLHTYDLDRKAEILEWCRQNHMRVHCLGVYMRLATFRPVVRWLVVDDKEKTMFKLKWCK